MENKSQVSYWKLFLSTFFLSAFTFGGGYVIVSLMRDKFVKELGWLEEQEMLDITAIAQSCPGVMAVNASILVGYKVAGAMGAAATIVGTVLPPLIILSVISAFYTAFQSSYIVNTMLMGMRAGVAAVITDVVVSMASGILKKKSVLAVCIMIGAFFMTYMFRINVVYIVIMAGFIGFIATMSAARLNKEGKI